MKEICKNCGIWEGYHRHPDKACPLGGEDSGEFYENKFYRQRLRQKKQPNEGLTKREIFAAMAMNGLCHDYGRNSCVETGTHENIAMISVKLADALIQKLNEGKENKND